jgi:hypothetical protein
VNKASTRILLIIIILALAAMACVGGGGGNGDRNKTNGGSGSFEQAGVTAPDATATYGTQQFQIQLTEIAREGQNQP